METSTPTKALVLTASERRFVMEMNLLKRMSLKELLLLERFRMPIGV